MERSFPASEHWQQADWYKPCSEEHLAEIAGFITEWREIAPFFGLTAAEEHEILGAIPPLSVRSQKMSLLRMWKEKKGRAATYDQLSRIFRKCGLIDLEEKVVHILEESKEDHSFKPSPAHSDPLASYASYLKELYMSMSSSHTYQHWSHLPRCDFIQLAMIKDEEMRRGGPEEEMIRLAQQGKIETVLGRKQSIDLHNLFPLPARPPSLVVQPPPQPGRVCLIEGAPGVGKSTLALQICKQWAQGASWLARFDVVILAYLRDEAVQNASTLADILPANDLDRFRNIASQVSSSRGAKVLFIFDGWDEFPPKLMDSSLVSIIIRQPAYKLSLHQSTVLITTRPVASGKLLHIADRRVEILGFTRHQIREYIEKALNGNSTHIQRLVQHFEKHPVIEGYCYIPLHSAILVHIFLTMNNKPLPTTLHELFCDLVLCCIVREHETHEPDSILPEMSSLDDLPDDLKSKLSNLRVLAYNGVMQDKIVFYSKDLKEFNLPDDLSSLGLVQAVEGFTKFSKTRSYNFLHLSVQELLAAYHISLMDTNEQVNVFKTMLVSSRFQPVLRYYSGFTKLVNPEIREFIFSYQHGKSNVKEILPLLHCFFEAHEPSLCQLVNPNFAGAISVAYYYMFDPSDFLAIGYFIASLLSTSNADMPSVVLRIDDSGDLVSLKLYC